MMAEKGEVHEPEAELLGAEEAIQDAARLREAFRQYKAGRVVPVRVPLWALLDALDALEPHELRQVARRAQDRLEAVSGR